MTPQERRQAVLALAAEIREKAAEAAVQRLLDAVANSEHGHELLDGLCELGARAALGSLGGR